ncbi:MAG: tripartite tricarboxylate transporter TctB family protein [Alphaproteobacteria bacterium]|nr:tripartite tricarboxylate transporter TctB family protein [Alphaproteobacteria bacterium]
MVRINRDSVVALVLLVFSGGMYLKSLEIQTRDDGIMRADVWPQTIILGLGILSLIYLFQSLRGNLQVEDGGGAPAGPLPGSGFTGWFSYYANPLWCFALYFAFLATLDWLGILIGGSLLVFMILNVLGGFAPGRLLKHALLATISIGSMWAVFTYALRVALPEGELLPLILPR